MTIINMDNYSGMHGSFLLIQLENLHKLKTDELQFNASMMGSITGTGIMGDSGRVCSDVIGKYRVVMDRIEQLMHEIVILEQIQGEAVTAFGVESSRSGKINHSDFEQAVERIQDKYRGFEFAKSLFAFLQWPTGEV